MNRFWRAPGRDPKPRQPADGRRLISLSMVKNEQDIIEPFIRHNARLVDCMIILDNASVDDTRRIAVECARDLGNVVVGDSEAFGYTQSERITRLLHGCQAAFFADYVFFLDADEFIGAASRAALIKGLDTVPSGAVGLMHWQTFVLAPNRPSADPPRSMRHRRAKEMPVYHKAVLRLDGACKPGLVVRQGGHDVVAGDNEVLPQVKLDTLPLLHFPVRSREQLMAKSVVGWMAYLARSPDARQSAHGFQWRGAFDRVVAGALGPSDLSDLSMQYAQDRPASDWHRDARRAAPPANYRRLHSTGRSADPVGVIARSWERSLVPSPALLDLRRPDTVGTEPGIVATSFDAAWHWDHLFADVAPFRFIAEMLCPGSVLDIGCGVGAYLQLFHRLGAETIVGVDGVPDEATALNPADYLCRDLSMPLELGRMFDVVLCVEVAEHIQPDRTDTLLESIVRHAGQAIVFSAAAPGQPGNGHINCQPLAHWLDRFAAKGWAPTLAHSLGMRALASMSWFRRNLVVLQRGASQDGAAAALAAIAAKPFTWHGQAPGIRQMPFLESGPLGYEGDAV